MNRVILGSAILGAMLCLGPTASLGAQGNGSATIPERVQRQLWPERALSPIEQELKDHVIVLRDSLAMVDASAALIVRQRRGGAGAAVLRSSSRRLASTCEAGAREGKVMHEFAKGLFTDDTKWGPLAVATFQAGAGDLVRHMGGCSSAATALAETEQGPDPEQLVKVALAAQAAVADYTIAAAGLLNTLNIRVDPRGTGQAGR